MLTLDNILWVIPGVTFVFLYNILRPSGSIQLSGWPYIFLLVFIAFLTWLPAEWLVTGNDYDKSSIPEKWFIVCLSILFSCVLLLLFKRTPLFYRIHFDGYDDFCFKCIGLENSSILLTLKNGKAYIGILWKYPEDPTEKYELQTISIIPLKSGFRREDKTIDWNTYYPHKDPKNEVVMLFPRSEIVNFAEFNPEVHEHFSKKIK